MDGNKGSGRSADSQAAVCNAQHYLFGKAAGRIRYDVRTGGKRYDPIFFTNVVNGEGRI